MAMWKKYFEIAIQEKRVGGGQVRSDSFVESSALQFFKIVLIYFWFKN